LHSAIADLQLDGTAQRVDDAGQLDQEAVAGRFDDAAPVLGDLRLDQLAARRLEPGEGASSSAPISRE
jgi:hypothetical protein